MAGFLVKSFWNWPICRGGLSWPQAEIASIRKWGTYINF